jgi:hypothetical protein
LILFAFGDVCLYRPDKPALEAARNGGTITPKMHVQHGVIDVDFQFDEISRKGKKRKGGVFLEGPD